MADSVAPLNRIDETKLVKFQRAALDAGWLAQRAGCPTYSDIADAFRLLRQFAAAAPLLLAEVKAQRAHLEAVEALRAEAENDAYEATNDYEGSTPRALIYADRIRAALGTADQPKGASDDEELSDGYVYRVRLGKRTWVCGGLPAAENARDALAPDAFIERQRVRYGDWVRVDPAAAADQPLAATCNCVGANSGNCPVHPLPGCPNPWCGETWVKAFHGDRCDSCGWAADQPPKGASEDA